jgi:glutathione S-transferase
MITLHGMPISNYYNKVKMALLEKGVPFTESYAKTHSHDEAVLSKSPLGKVPFLTTEHGGLCESQAIMEWIEAAWPTPPLLPADPYAAAKVRELTTFLDWHLEITARQLYGVAFFGAPPLSEANSQRIRKQLVSQVEAVKRMLKFAPFAAGDTFTQADCSAFNHLPVVAMASKAVYGEDLLESGGIDHRSYTKFIGQRPSAQKVVADRKASQAPKAA